MTFRLSPGVYLKETNLAIIPQAVATSICASAFACNRGSLEPFFAPNRQVLLNEYGKPDPRVGYGVDQGIHYLDEGVQFWGLRIPGDGYRYSVGVIANNWNPSTGKFFQSSFFRVPGSAQYKQDGIRQMTDLVFSAALVSLNTINLAVNENAIAQVTFSTDNNTTLKLVAAAIQAELDELGSFGKAEVVDYGQGVTANRTIRIVAPTDVNGAAIEITIDDIVVAAGASQATATQRPTNVVMWAFSRNPGLWGDGLALRINNRDQGQAERWKLSFSAALVASNVVTCTYRALIDNVPVGPFTVTTTYATSSDATMAAFAVALKASIDANVKAGTTAVVTAITGSAVDDRDVVLTAPDGTVELSFDVLNVTAGASQATINKSRTLNRRAPTGEFDLAVYEYPSLNSPKESPWRCSMVDRLDGFNVQLQVEEQVNRSATKSSLIWVETTEDYPEADRVLFNDITFSNATKAGFLLGGDNGTTPTLASYISALQKFADPEKVTFRIFIDGGYTVPEYQQAIDILVSHRQDSFGVYTVPSNQQNTMDAGNYRTNILNIDSTYGAIYSPDVLIFDEFSAKRRYVPAAGLIAAQYAYTDRVTHEWFAPAGLNRGVIKRAIDLRVTYGEGDRDYLSQLQVNTIRKIGPAFPIWGEYTLASAVSPLQSVPGRRLLTSLEIQITDGMKYYTFDPNSPATRIKLKQLADQVLTPIYQGGGLRSFESVCDDSNNTDPLVAARELHLDVYVIMILPALYLELQAIVTKQGVNFSELIRTGGNF